MQLLAAMLVSLVWVVVIVFSFVTGYNFHKFRDLRRKRLELERAHEGVHKHDVPETTQIINGIKYSSMDAKCIAQGPNTFGWTWLMQTNKDNYFVIQTMLGVQALQPVTKDQAIQLHASCNVHEVPFEKAFPGVDIRDA